MTEPSTIAIIPAFLRFRVTALELDLGPVHGGYDTLVRRLSANLQADPQQKLTSDAGMLDRCEGSLSILEDPDLHREWTGSIQRLKPYLDRETRYRSGDYRVSLDLQPAAFDRLLSLVQTGQQLFGLSLDFQNIDVPGDGLLPVDDPWDDLQYPHVALTSFRLRWKPAGQPGLPSFLWPATPETPSAT